MDVPFFERTGRHSRREIVSASKRGPASITENVRDFCREDLAGYKKPREVVFVDELACNALGMVLKHETREESSETEE